MDGLRNILLEISWFRPFLSITKKKLNDRNKFRLKNKRYYIKLIAEVRFTVAVALHKKLI